MRVLIYGGGAVGLGIASCLIRSGTHIDIVGREETVKALREAGLSRRGIFGRVHAKPQAFRCAVEVAQVAERAYDFVLVCTKSFDTAPAAQDLAEHRDQIGPEARFVLFQNGWGNAEVFGAHFPRERIYSARVITGFHRHQPNEVEITVHADAIHIGSLTSGDLSVVQPLCRAIADGGVPCEMTDAIEKDLWAKMLYNCALNPLGAILGVPYGALAAEASTRMLMDRIVEEVFAVMAAAGYQTHWREPAQFLDVFYSRLVPDTAAHESSTLQDLAAGKRTEIEALNGAVLKLAARHGIDAPCNQAVTNLVQFSENHGTEAH